MSTVSPLAWNPVVLKELLNCGDHLYSRKGYQNLQQNKTKNTPHLNTTETSPVKGIQIY